MFSSVPLCLRESHFSGGGTTVETLSWDAFVAGGIGGEALALTIGVFDGVHRGHRALIGRLGGRGLVPAALTFLHNPKRLLSPGSYGGDLLSLRQKLALLEELGIERTVLIDFSGDFGKMGGWDFISLVKSRARLGFLAVGENFRCGHRLDTGAVELRGRLEGEGIPVELLSPVREGGEPVSSSRIRAAVGSGDFALAAALLGRNFVLDLLDIPGEPGVLGGREGVFFDPAFRCRAGPRKDGCYRVLVRGGRASGGEETAVSVSGGRVFVPAPFRGGEIEFLREDVGPESRPSL